MQYGLQIYNAKFDTAKRAQLTVQTRLFLDGKPIFEGKPQPLDTAGQTDLTHLDYGSAISLPAQMQPGDYVLQIIVSDALAKAKQNIAAQSIEFELIN